MRDRGKREFSGEVVRFDSNRRGFDGAQFFSLFFSFLKDKKLLRLLIKDRDVEPSS